MYKTYHIAILSLVIIAFGFVTKGFAQKTPFPNVLGSTKGSTPPDSLKVGEMQTMQERIEELRKAGLSEDQIQAYLNQNGGDKPQTQNGTPQQPLEQLPPSQNLGGTFPQQPQIPQNLGKNPPYLTLYNEGTQKIDTFWTAKQLQHHLQNTEQKRRQREYEQALADPNTLFGRHIFIKEDFTRADTSTFAPPDDYVVQPGDKFFVQITGPAELFEQLEVDKDGTVFRQYVGKKSVGGSTYKDARKMLENAYRKITAGNPTIQITLTKNKGGISVNVVGEVKAPGTYSLPNVTSALSALFAAEGINELGSVRSILVKRAGKTVGEIDLYAYLIEGKTNQIYLKHNDYVYVPMQKGVVQIVGGVKRPMRYEIKEGETVRDIIKYAGGLNYDASMEKAQIARLEYGKDVLIDFNLNGGMDKSVQDGDIVRVKTLYRKNDAIAQIEGTVRYPGTYHYVKGERVQDLIDMAGGLTENAYMDRAYVTRITPGEIVHIPINLNELNDTTQNIRIMGLDKLIIYNKTMFRDNRISVQVAGKVKNPGYYDISKKSVLKDILYMAGGLAEDAEKGAIQLTYTTIQKDDVLKISYTEKSDRHVYKLNTDLKNPILTISKISSERAEEIGDSLFLQYAPKGQVYTKLVSLSDNWQTDVTLDTLAIGKYRYITVFAEKDFLRPQLLQITGAVANGQTLIPSTGMTLKDVIYACGGIREDALLDYVDLYTRMEDNERGNFSLKTNQREIIRVKVSKDWKTDPKIDSILIAPYYQIVLHDQGQFIEKGFFTVKGLVREPGQLEYKPKMTLKDALYQAGGIKIESDYSKIEISRILDIENTNGEIIPLSVKTISVSTRQDWQSDPALENIAIFPYDQIFVRPNPEFKLQEGVFIDGEVLVPGEYVKRQVDERISDLVAKAGGLTKLSYVEGATLERPEYGTISIRLDKAIEKPGSIYDLKLQKGDRLIIPPVSEIVRVSGNVFKPNSNFLYEPSRKNSKYYIELAGGMEKKTVKRRVTVTYLNGRVKKTKRYMFFLYKYPKVMEGAVVNVPKREEKPEEKAANNIILKDRLNEIIASATSIVTFLVLIRAATR